MSRLYHTGESFMARRISPIGRVIGGKHDNCFVYWLIEKDGEDYFLISPNQRLRLGMFIQLDDNPIICKIYMDDLVRVTRKDEAFLHEDLDLFTKKWGKISVRVNKQAASKLKSASKNAKNLDKNR